MTPKRAFKGVWIPAFIWDDKDLTWFEKVLLSEISALDNDEGCFASNKHLAEVLQSTPDSIQSIISKLRKKGWIFDRVAPSNAERIISVVCSKMEHEKLQSGLLAGLMADNPGLMADNPKQPHHIYSLGTRESSELLNSKTKTQETTLFESQKTEEEVYKIYPRKVAPGKALPAIRKQIRMHGAQLILETTRKFAALWEGAIDKKFCPYPATWFNGQRFLEDPSEWPQPDKESPEAELRRLRNIRDRHQCNSTLAKHNPNAPESEKEAYRKIKARIKELEQLTGQ